MARPTLFVPFEVPDSQETPELRLESYRPAVENEPIESARVEGARDDCVSDHLELSSGPMKGLGKLGCSEEAVGGMI
jgi:hypothetical protein